MTPANCCKVPPNTWQQKSPSAKAKATQGKAKATKGYRKESLENGLARYNLPPYTNYFYTFNVKIYFFSFYQTSYLN
jgi:hypothetical protein